MSTETGPAHNIQVVIDDTTLSRSLQVLNSSSQICACDGTASRVLACLYGTGPGTVANSDPTAREEWKAISKATKWCAQGGLNKVTERLTGRNPENQ